MTHSWMAPPAVATACLATLRWLQDTPPVLADWLTRRDNYSP